MSFHLLRRLDPYSVTITMMMVGGLLIANESWKSMDQIKEKENFTQMVNRTRHCQKLRFRTSSSNATALVSFPGSGNTWTRHLIQEATGLYTGAIYNNSRLRLDFPGEGIHDGRVVAFKTHDHNDKKKRRPQRVILLVRNPCRASMAEYARQRTKSQTKNVAQTFNWTQGWYEFYMKNLKGWFKFHEGWLTRTEPMLVVTYNNLRKDTIHEMKKIVKFLNVKASDSNLKCMSYNSEGLYHRKSIPMAANTFNEEMISVTRKYIGIINKTMKERYGVTIDASIPTNHTG